MVREPRQAQNCRNQHSSTCNATRLSSTCCTCPLSSCLVGTCFQRGEEGGSWLGKRAAWPKQRQDGDARVLVAHVISVGCLETGVDGDMDSDQQVPHEARLGDSTRGGFSTQGVVRSAVPSISRAFVSVDVENLLAKQAPKRGGSLTRSVLTFHLQSLLAVQSVSVLLRSGQQ